MLGPREGRKPTRKSHQHSDKGQQKRSQRSLEERGQNRTCPQLAPALLTSSFELHHTPKEPTDTTIIKPTSAAICKLIFHAHSSCKECLPSTKELFNDRKLKTYIKVVMSISLHVQHPVAKTRRTSQQCLLCGWQAEPTALEELSPSPFPLAQPWASGSHLNCTGLYTATEAPSAKRELPQRGLHQLLQGTGWGGKVFLLGTQCLPAVKPLLPTVSRTLRREGYTMADHWSSTQNATYSTELTTGHAPF